MSDPTLQFPEPEANDVEDAVLALETAGALWKKGDAQEAVRWLRRAAEAAEEGGDDLRAVALARAAADLSTAAAEATKRSSGKEPTSDPKKPKLPDAPPLTKKPTIASAGAKAAAPEQELPAPPPRRPASPASGPASKGIPPSAVVTSQRPPPPSQRPMPAAPAGKTEKEKPEKVKNEPGSSPLNQLAALAKSETTSSPLASSGPITMATPKSSKASAGLKALRVAVERIADEDGAFKIRVLEGDAPVPAGAQSAILVALEQSLDLLKRA